MVQVQRHLDLKNRVAHLNEGKAVGNRSQQGEGTKGQNEDEDQG